MPEEFEDFNDEKDAAADPTDNELDAIDGKLLTITEFAKKACLPRSTIVYKIKKGIIKVAGSDFYKGKEIQLLNPDDLDMFAESPTTPIEKYIPKSPKVQIKQRKDGFSITIDIVGAAPAKIEITF